MPWRPQAWWRDGVRAAAPPDSSTARDRAARVRVLWPGHFVCVMAAGWQHERLRRQRGLVQGRLEDVAGAYRLLDQAPYFGQSLLVCLAARDQVEVPVIPAGQ